MKTKFNIGERLSVVKGKAKEEFAKVKDKVEEKFAEIKENGKKLLNWTEKKVEEVFAEPEMSLKVQRLLSDAESEAMDDKWCDKIKVRHLVVAMFEDEDSELTKYLRMNKCFSLLAVSEELMDLDEDEEEMDYQSFLEEIRSGINWVRQVNDAEMKSEKRYESKEYKYSDELDEVLRDARKLAKKAKKQEVDEEALIVCLLKYPNPIWDYVREYCEFMDKILEHYTEEWYLEEVNKKEKFSDKKQSEKEPTVVYKTTVETETKSREESEVEEMLTCLNDKFKKDEPKVIRKRDNEIEKAFIVLQKMGTRNVILLGKPGVGKTAIVEGIAESIVKETCPEYFKDKKIMSFDINTFMSDTKYVGQFEGKVKKLVNYLKGHKEVILFIDEMHNIIGAGRTTNSSYDFANALKPILTTGEIGVIGATTKKEYDKWITGDGALKRRFEAIEVEKPKNEQLYEMLSGQIERLSNYHKVTVSKESFDSVVSFAAGMNYNVENPARTFDALDTSMALAHQEGKKELDIISIMKVYKNNIDRFNLLKEKKSEALRLTAIHECGHCIVSKELCSEILDVQYLSIIPTDSYLGINVYDKNELDAYAQTKNELINQIAISLAGDNAVKMFTGQSEAGKRQDIETASRIADDMILMFGMQDEGAILGTYGSFGRKGSIDFSLLSDEQRNELVKQREGILKDASRRADKAIKENKEKMDILVEALMERGALNKEEINGLYYGKVKLEDLPPANIELINKKF